MSSFLISLVLFSTFIVFSGFSLGSYYENGNVKFILEKDAINSTVQLGNTATFLLNVTNNGTEELTNFSLGDEYNTSFLNFTSATQAPDDVNYTLGRIKWYFNLTADSSFNITVYFDTLTSGNTTNMALVFNETNNPFVPLIEENDTITISGGYQPINVTLIYPDNGATINETPFNMTWAVNIMANCSRYWNESGEWSNNNHSVISSPGNSSLENTTPSNGVYKWNVYCFQIGNQSNNDSAAVAIT